MDIDKVIEKINLRFLATFTDNEDITEKTICSCITKEEWKCLLNIIDLYKISCECLGIDYKEDSFGKI